MSQSIDYYFAPHSPWAYLGHPRLLEIAQTHSAKINVLPVDLGGKVFPVSGGLPLTKRAPQRLAYRLADMRRVADHVGLPLNPQPAYFPVPAHEAAQLIIAAEIKDGAEAALALSNEVMKAVWALEQNIEDPRVLGQALERAGLPAQRLEDAHTQAVASRYETNTERAIEVGVFGSPSYVVEGEIFWGQDRLDYLALRLARG